MTIIKREATRLQLVFIPTHTIKRMPCPALFQHSILREGKKIKKKRRVFHLLMKNRFGDSIVTNACLLAGPPNVAAAWAVKKPNASSGVSFSTSSK
jgi:hypothetical protein